MSKYFPIFGPRFCFYCDDVDDVDDIVVFGRRRRRFDANANADAEMIFTMSKTIPRWREREREKSVSLWLVKEYIQVRMYIYGEWESFCYQNICIHPNRKLVSHTHNASFDNSRNLDLARRLLMAVFRV